MTKAEELIPSVTIVKVGTGVLTLDDGRLNEESITALAINLAELRKTTNVILVSSGAVGAGVPRLNLAEYPSDISTRQAAAAIGQPHLLNTYEQAFQPHGVMTAQLLLSSYDLREESHRERAKTVLLRLLENERIIPIVNENDVVSLRELTKTDNDMLAANLAQIMQADLLILLTSVDGILNQEKQVITSFKTIQEARELVTEDSGKFSIGGMNSKLDAVAVALANGTKVVIGNGERPERLPHYATATALGSYFS